jgi:hypothetical protein
MDSGLNYILASRVLFEVFGGEREQGSCVCCVCLAHNRVEFKVEGYLQDWFRAKLRS